MAVVDIGELAARLSPGRRLLGADLGAKTIGLACSDATLTVATPLLTLRRRRCGDDLRRLRQTIEDREGGGLVIGLPIRMDGSEGERCQAVRQFARDLLREVDLPVAFWDERLSSRAVERMLIGEADMSRKRRREVIDKLAAAYLLQAALDAIAAARR
jgi:putative Holliday junction resolvase